MGANTQKIPDANARNASPARWQEEENQAMLERILDKLDKIERTVNKLDNIANQAPEAMVIATNFIDDTAGRIQENGQNPEERMKKLQSVINRATSPKALDKANAALEAVEQADDMITFAVDQLDEFVMTLQNHGLDPKEMSEDGLKFLSMMVSAHHKAMQNPPQKVGLLGMLRELSDPDFQKFLGFITTLGKNFGRGI